ncbi:NAD(P)-binding domain-containing protein [Actinosynnema mirum]|uniref:FAD-dependent pyridine nucleotide-disulphide oxidoreductase n=1 Tax=Actinosynnema mirum (strain ATCC 29888 / DSM 43827 / JCM 3225 / NBRC 14064 / NCIMB 13271 / NRRL B-12336 / IMRU 3971 / 101) TaxID=446462 RepID=C6WE44_ACTMD|nr:NAD(P)-binding domain-containing protein [Actinosynnema mirum]ACU35787.1 FAD-dependent pyridine nucleotide-disulphide oxidoreductase [Actinosynnema mirum DSM 43827]
MPEVEYLIVGAGPAGLQLAHLLDRAGRSCRVLEAGPAPGQFFRAFPRHRRLLSVNEGGSPAGDPELDLRRDAHSLLSDGPAPRFPDHSADRLPHADDLARYLVEFARATGVDVRCDTRVLSVTRSGFGGFRPRFRVVDQRGGTHTARWVVVATGLAKPHLPPIPGIDRVEHYGAYDPDPRGFAGQRVLVVGKGNSAFEVANSLVRTASAVHVVGPRPARVAWRSRRAGDVRAVNAEFLDAARFGVGAALLDGSVLDIRADDDSGPGACPGADGPAADGPAPGGRPGGYAVTVALRDTGGATRTIRYDRVVVATGFRFDTGIFGDGARPAPAPDDRFPALTAEWESTSVPGLHFAGALMRDADDHSSTGDIHGFRYAVRALARVLERKNHGVPWPSTEVPADDLVPAVLARVNRSSALWHQRARLADVVVPGGATARYLEEVPVDLVAEHAPDCLAITLEHVADHLADRAEDHADPDASAPLRPVVRRFRGGEVVAEHRVAADLEHVWTDPDLHLAPLRAFLSRQLVIT